MSFATYRLRRAFASSYSACHGLLLAMVLLLLTGCGSDFASPLIGTWKDTDNNRYMSIERKSAESNGGHKIEYEIVVFTAHDQPSLTSLDTNGIESTVSVSADAVKNSRTLSAELLDGILYLTTDEGSIPLLFNPNDQHMYINGTDQFKRVNTGA